VKYPQTLRARTASTSRAIDITGNVSQAGGRRQRQARFRSSDGPAMVETMQWIRKRRSGISGQTSVVQWQIEQLEQLTL